MTDSGRPVALAVPGTVIVPPEDGVDERLRHLTEDADAARADTDVVQAALDLAARWGQRVPLPGSGRTAGLWSALATLGAADLTVARVVEPHLDALAILAEAPELGGTTPPDEATWGVYAAEAPGHRLEAHQVPGGWRLDGHKPWCSLADRVTHALVTAWTGPEDRGLFAVDLRSPGVRPVPADGRWVGHGLPLVTSCGVDFAAVPAIPVGGPGWYLQRPGFAWGGIGVAAVWYGAAVAIARTVAQRVRRREPDQIAQLHLGQLDLVLAQARESLASAAAHVDGRVAAGVAPDALALRARGAVAQCVDTVIRVADHAMGPAPLAHDADHARRVSDLRLYVRQHHAERDVAALGRLLLDRAEIPW